MIERDISNKIYSAAKQFPIVCLMGPRQSGKTTLVKHLFPKATYLSFEDPDIRAKVKDDYRGFLSSHKGLVIIDEAQRLPEVFSYLQTIVDDRGKNGQFIFTGSQNYLLLEKVTQSLAGRVAILKLLPLSVDEISAAGKPTANLDLLIHKGFYPGIWKQRANPGLLYSSYVNTYLERDVRQIQNVSSLSEFQKFLKMCAGRAGQILNLSSLGNDCGISHNTAKAWLSILESGFIVHLLQPYFENLNKRLVKTPKLYFYDTGLLCHLLDIHEPSQLRNHHLRGALMENFVFAELQKQNFNRLLHANIYYWRDKTGNEVDFLIPRADKKVLVEVKAGQTMNSDFTRGIDYYRKLDSKSKLKSFLVYTGKQDLKLNGTQFLQWKNSSMVWK